MDVGGLGQITCVELSKKLKELGYPQKGLWKWARYSQDDAPEEWTLELCWPGLMMIDCIAPTVAELGDALGQWKRDTSAEEMATMYSSINSWLSRHWFKEKITEANARAKLLIFLYEHKLKLKDIKKREVITDGKM